MQADVRTYVVTVDATGVPEEELPALRRELRIAVEVVCRTMALRHQGVDITLRVDDVQALLGGDDAD